MPMPPKTKKSNRKKIILISIAALVMAVAFLLTFREINRNRQFEQDKKNYAAAERNLDELISEIKASAGEPYEIKKEKSCQYVSAQKYDSEELSCSVGYRFVYETNSDKESKSKFDLIKVITKYYGGFSIRDEYYSGSVNFKGNNYSITYDKSEGKFYNSLRDSVNLLEKRVESAIASEFSIYSSVDRPVKPVYPIKD